MADRWHQTRAARQQYLANLLIDSGILDLRISQGPTYESDRLLQQMRRHLLELLAGYRDLGGRSAVRTDDRLCRGFGQVLLDLLRERAQLVQLTLVVAH